MAKKQEKQTLTRAQKTEAAKGLFRELLAVKPMRHNELIDEVAKLYKERYEDTDTENVNDVKGRVGSVLDIMKKESDVAYDGGTYALKARLPQPPAEKAEEKAPAKKTVKRTTKKKTEEAPKEEKVAPVEGSAEAKVEKQAAPVAKKRGRKKKEEAPVAEAAPLPVAEQPTEKTEEKSPVKKTTKRTAKKKAEPLPPVEEKVEDEPVQKAAPVVEEKPVETSAPVMEALKAAEKAPVETPVVEKTEVKTEKKELIVKPKAELAQKGVVMDMSFLFGDKTPKAAPRTERAEKVERAEKKEEKAVPTPAPAPAVEKKERPAPKATSAPKAEGKEAPAKPVEAKADGEQPKTQTRRQVVRSPRGKITVKPLTAEEKLKESFLKRMRTLGGDYFEYYSVYLLERYSMKNGRRLEGLRISGGDHDGGIDGEIELTDKFGFKETIYIQSKNWDPDKGKEENWVVGETLLQQFIGACACRQAKDGKQHCRGIFVTTSRFTPDAKRILDAMSDKIVGYDGNDLFEAAKECEFGLVKKNGEWALDEKLLSGTKAFFQML